MKTMNLSKTARLCGWVVALSCLPFTRPAFAQTVEPTPLSFFLAPTAEYFVRITSPANHATFYTPVDIPIFAFAREELLAPGANGVEYTNVAFYANSVLLGEGFSLTSTNPPPRAFPWPRTWSGRCPVWGRCTASFGRMRPWVPTP